MRQYVAEICSIHNQSECQGYCYPAEKISEARQKAGNLITSEQEIVKSVGLIEIQSNYERESYIRRNNITILEEVYCST